MSHDLTTQAGIAAALQTGEGIAAMEGVCAKLPGLPWSYKGVTETPGHYEVVGCVLPHRTGVILDTFNFDCVLDPEQQEAVAVFAAMASTALPLALAELRRLREERDRLREAVGKYLRQAAARRGGGHRP